MNIKSFSTTGIGSLPHTNAEEACRFVMQYFDIPFWPQLPKVSFKESMIAQFTEGMPFVRFDNIHETITIVRDGSDELERFYERWTEQSRIAISSDYAEGLHAFLKLAKMKRFDTLKAHITGPLTFTLSIKDGSGRFIYFDEEIREIALMTLKSKILWQIDMVKNLADNIIFFIDEPVFTAIGSTTYMGVEETEVMRLLSEIVETIKNAGAISCIHCCGKADWQMVINSSVDMISFDAFEYFETFNIYHDVVGDFVKKGGYLVWGIVPTSDIINEVGFDHVLNKFKNNLSTISRHIDRELVMSRSLLSPACGTGSRTINETTKIVQLLMRLKEEMAVL
ncbi:MAG: hypothetical protein N2738_01130 [Thermodesulfovibrionales bacterium]|nr:hypothetical protein [Thermodesulfovibrionales bacterium]